MTLELVLERRWPGDYDIIGRLADGEGPLFYTLEPSAKAEHPCIPAGRYPVKLTPSGRAIAGTLWSPRTDHQLPEICDVPDRTAIRFHAGNGPENTQGCILVGFGRSSERRILESRLALIDLMAKIEAADETWLTITEEA